jgi:plasmid stabilization system protein ParE
MSVFADTAAAKLSTRLRAIPEKLRTISDLADHPGQYAQVVRPRRSRRFSTRRLMILIAVVALFLSVLRVLHNRLYCQRQAALHEAMAEFHRGGWPTKMNASDAFRLFAGMRRRPALAIHHSRMRVKWQNAADRPWLRVEDDPP